MKATALTLAASLIVLIETPAIAARPPAAAPMIDVAAIPAYPTTAPSRPAGRGRAARASGRHYTAPDRKTHQEASVGLGSTTLIDHVSGAIAYVSARALPRFACLLGKLDAAGYPVKEIGGFGERPNNASAHPTGNALDVNQCGRNCVSPRLPKGFADMAEACGLVSGSTWRGSPDTGHFEMPDKIGYVFPGRRYTHYASHRRARYASK
jgi:hypothetical protein